jgi:hypothetical protein
MSESRQLDNDRMKRELGLSFCVTRPLNAGMQGVMKIRILYALDKSVSSRVRRQLVRRPVLSAAHFCQSGARACRIRSCRISSGCCSWPRKLHRFVTPIALLAIGSGFLVMVWLRLFGQAGCMSKRRWSRDSLFTTVWCARLLAQCVCAAEIDAWSCLVSLVQRSACARALVAICILVVVKPSF